MHLNIPEITLSKGNHKTAQDGLCYMEMAAWFAGEKHSDRPQCACPVLGAYGIGLNDAMPDDLRNTLLKPTVPMIVGTRDPDAERRRAEFLAMWAVNKMVPIALRSAGMEAEALRCEGATTLRDANAAARAAANADVWPVAVEGLIQAIKLGRHEPPAIDWDARKAELIEAVA